MPQNCFVCCATGFPHAKHHIIGWFSKSKRSSKGSSENCTMRAATDMVQYFAAAPPLPKPRFRFFSGPGELVPEPSDSNSVLAIMVSKRRGNCNSYTGKLNTTNQRVDGTSKQAQTYNASPLWLAKTWHGRKCGKKCGKMRIAFISPPGLGVCYVNDPPKWGYMASAPVLDLTTSLRGNFPGGGG